MFISNSVYARVVSFIDLNDIDFFKESLRLAKDNMTTSVSKLQSPVLFASRLSKQSTTESNLVPRSLMYGDRARRKFIMLDVDYNESENDKLDKLLQNAKALAQKHNTFLLVYPTLSYPVKPRCRIVFFVKRLMNARNYEQSVRWLAQELDYPLTDEADLRLTANRNMPVFSSQEQVDAIISNLDEEELAPLDNKLWSSVEIPKRVNKEHKFFDGNSKRLEQAYDTERLTECMHIYVTTHDVSSYVSVWRLIESIALDVLDGYISRESADMLMEQLASVADNPMTVKSWSDGNKQLLSKLIDRIQSGERSISYIKPLVAFNACFLPLLRFSEDRLAV